jgi:hypothetical protein
MLSNFYFITNNIQIEIILVWKISVITRAKSNLSLIISSILLAKILKIAF